MAKGRVPERRRQGWVRVALVAAGLLLVALVGVWFGAERFLWDLLRPSSPHQHYARSLRQSGLDQTALGRDWLAAADRALRSPLQAVLPFREEGYFAPEEAAAVGYRMEMRRGQRLVAEVEMQAQKPCRLFVDVFEATDSSSSPWPVAYAAPDSPRLEFEAQRDGVYVLRLQPELLRGGRYTLMQRLGASLRFPVEGKDSAAVKSVFGDERDFGQRQHEGVDIFAPSGTPVLAAADGFVTSVATTELGGNVVWLWDRARGLDHYYAHLLEQKVRFGARVRAGDVLGTVGNTGNARTTPPHLHFGLYSRTEGALDPFPFVHDPGLTAPEVMADTRRLGDWARVSPSTLGLLAWPEEGAPLLAELPQHTVVVIDAAYAEWYRVRLPDGTAGYASASRMEPLAAPIRKVRRATEIVVRDGPLPTAAPLERLAAGTPVPVFGRFAGYLFVRTANSRSGWVEGGS